jgi:hypothetical protein
MYIVNLVRLQKSSSKANGEDTSQSDLSRYSARVRDRRSSTANLARRGRSAAANSAGCALAN